MNADKLGDMAGVCVGRFEDSRGEILNLDFHGQKVNLVFSKAGSYRSGDVHPNVQRDVVLSGAAAVRRLDETSDWERTYSPGRGFSIRARVPHLFYFPKDTAMLEWWDGPFSAEYYEPYRKIVRESMEAGRIAAARQGVTLKEHRTGQESLFGESA